MSRTDATSGPFDAPSLATRVAITVLAIVLASGIRLLIDRYVHGVVVFPLIFPALAVATFVAGWQSGLAVIVGCQLLAWYFLLSPRYSFAIDTAADAVSLSLSTAAQLLLLWFVARYRGAERRAAALMAAQRDELERTVALMRQQAGTNQRLVTQEQELKATRQNLEAIYQASGDGLALCEAFRDETGRVVEYQVLEVNRAHAELTSATREQMLGQRVSTIDPPIDPRWFETATRVLDTGLMHDFDVRSRANGRWLNIRVSKVSDTLFQQTFVDVSDRYRLEEQRRALLKEMSHRVMNNFQMVAGFLHLEAASADAAAKARFQVAEQRIQVLAKLHSLLAYTESEGDIDAGAYLRELCGYLASTLERPEAVTMACDATDVRLPTDMVVPLGFIVTELVTNSAKYAYPPPLAGNIRVALTGDRDGWTLSVDDDGRGLNASGAKPAGGLGTRLVERFVRQLGATMTTISDGGVRHRIVYGAAAP